MANPRPLSIVKIKPAMLNDFRVESFGLRPDDRFIYFGEIAQDPTRCIVQGLFCGKRIPYLPPSAFEEVASNDF